MAATQPPAASPPRDSTLRHVVTATLYTIVSVLALGVVYPVVVWAIGSALFPHQAGGSLIVAGGAVIGSELVGQKFTRAGYFHGRPSAAGNGYDPTQTGGTNLGPTSKKLIVATKSAIAALRKENPDATGPVPMDLVTSSASGIDPDVSPEGAYYQARRVAMARGLRVDAVRALVAAHVTPRQFGLFGEPRVNVLALNRALDALAGPAK